MVFGFAKRDRRVPDLSRYDYYYQNHEDYNKSPQLSAAAASAASAASPDRTNYSRSHSLISHAPPVSKQRGSVKSPGRRLSTSSAVPPSSKGTAKPYSQKTYSLRSQMSGEYHLHPPGHTNNGSRMNSMTSGTNTRRNYGSKNNPTSGNNSDSRANSITVRTTQVTDPTGRTQSITKKTIKKINGYEYVETTTTTKNLVPLGDSQRHFDEFSGNYMLQDDDIMEEQNGDNIHDIIEENETDNENPYSPVKGHRVQHDSELNMEKPDFPPGSYFHHKYSTDIMPLEEESSLSNFSDALDYIPPTKQPNNKYIHNKRKQASTTRKKKKHPVVKTPEPTVKKPLTEAEMYLKALEIAKRNVYHTDTPPDKVPASLGSTKSRKSRMGQNMTLRNGNDSPTVAAKPVTEARPKRISKSALFHRNGNNEPHEERSNPTMSHSKSERVVEPVLESQHANIGLTDEEMYDQALKIAQARYYNSHGIQPETTKNTNTAAKLNQTSINDSVPTEKTTSIKQRSSGGGPQLPVQTEVHEYEAIPLQKTKTAGSSKNKLKTMFDKVLQFSQENYGYQHKNDQEHQAPVNHDAEESFQAVSTPEGMPTIGPSSNYATETNSAVESPLPPPQQQTESARSSSPPSSHEQDQSHTPTLLAASTTRTRTPEQQETIKSSSSLLQDQTPQRQENATDPTTTTTTNEMYIVEPTTSPAIPNEMPISQPTMGSTTYTTETKQAQAQASSTKHKKSGFFTKLFRKKNSR